jgi:acyl-CoA synthetase (AMP-forming)/AMP-acid ligase II
MTELDPHHVAGTSLSDLLDQRADQRAGAPYLLAVRDDRRVSFADMATSRHDVWGALTARGVEPGSRIGLLIADPVDFARTFIGALAAGFWVCPFDAATPATGHARLVERFDELELAAVISDRVDRLGTAAWVALPLVSRPDVSAPATMEGGVVLSSSGTTGSPKVIALSTSRLLHTAALIARHNQLTAADRGLNPLPLFHINAEVVAILASLVAGSSIALDDRFHRTGFWDNVDRLEVTWVNAVPAIVSRLVALRPGEVVPPRLRFVRSASAPLPAATLEAFESTIGVPVLESYGMTEAGSQICVNPLDGIRKPGSVGRPVGVELRIVVVEGEIEGADPDQPLPGHVEIRGPSVITRYESPGYQDRFDAEGWLRTGDLGIQDAEGYVFLMGRSDDVINRGGEKMFPREIEEVILSVAGVRSAAVIGAPDDVFGQLPVSFVELEDVDASSEDLAILLKTISDALSEALVRERRPVSISLVRSMPTIATGKVHKPSLRKGEVDVIQVERLQ